MSLIGAIERDEKAAIEHRGLDALESPQVQEAVRAGADTGAACGSRENALTCSTLSVR